VEIAESYADGTANDEDLRAAEMGVHPLPSGDPIRVSAASAAAATLTHDHSRSWSLAAGAIAATVQGGDQAAFLATGNAELDAQVALLRDIFGNPFRPVTLVPAHRTQDVISLARAAYDERQLPSGELEWDRLAVLADALEEGGCDEATILDHLRSPGPHVRGCWALDMALCLS